jgi:hypothetical protein
MAVSANQIVKRQGRDGKLGVAPVAANVILYEGTLAYLDANGRAVPTITDQNTRFLGIVRNEVNSNGFAAGALSVEFWTDGDFELPLSTASLLQADTGKTAYGVDNYAVSETAAAQPPVGIFKQFLTTSLAVVSIKGLGDGIVAPGTT